MNLPSIALGVDGREWHTAVNDVEVGLVLQHQLALDTGWNSLREADESGGTDVPTALEVSDWCGEDRRQASQGADLLEHVGVMCAWSEMDELWTDCR